MFRLFSMYDILTKLLRKRGIDSLDQLDKEEKQTFENWQKILSKEELTLEDVKHFCQTQCEIIKGKWSNYDLENAKKAELIPYFTVYNTLLAAIDSPKSARSQLEQHLNQLVQ